MTTDWPEPQQRTRPDGTHRIEFELLRRPTGYEPWPADMPTTIVQYWPETPREGEHVELTYEGDDLEQHTISANVRAVLWGPDGVPVVRIV